MSTTTIVRPAQGVTEAFQLPRLTMACLVASDTLALVASVAFAVVCKRAFLVNFQWTPYLGLWPFLFVFLAVYGTMGLYSAVSLGAPEELRRTTLASSLVFLCLGAATVGIRGGSRYVTPALMVALAGTVVLTPLFRALARRWFGRSSWWGSPAVLFGAGEGTLRVAQELKQNPAAGLRPIAVLDDSAQPADRLAFLDIEQLPLVSGFNLEAHLSGARGDAYAVVVMSGASHDRQREMLERYGACFSHVLVVPDLPGFSTRWMGSRSVAGLWGLEVRRRGMQRSAALVKRLLDLLLCAAVAPIAIPVAAAVALMVKLTSPGPIFYSHRRIGFGGAEFRVWKFRTMLQDSGKLLEGYLEANPEARVEWEQTRKLKCDPRLTSIGAFLRRSSLDEVPQLWNVLRGEMSVVGPRPIVRDEVELYGDSFELYTQMPAGITGWWQVSGRNDTTYEQRVKLDVYYAQNWSIWLDLCILAQTVEAVVSKRGAY